MGLPQVGSICGEWGRCHTANVGCFFNAVVGSGIWVHLGNYSRPDIAGRDISNMSFTVFVPTSTPSEDGYTVTKVLSRLGPSDLDFNITAGVSGPRGSVIDVTPSTCRGRKKIGLRTCPDNWMLRAGWRATRRCACNDSWAFLNCFGEAGHRLDVSAQIAPLQTLRRARWGPWLTPWYQLSPQSIVVWPG